MQGRSPEQRKAAAEFYRINLGRIELPDVGEKAWPDVEAMMIRLGVIQSPKPPKKQRLPKIQLPE